MVAPVSAGAMVAVNVTAAGLNTGFALEVSVTAGVALFTTCATAGDVLVKYRPDGKYEAVIVWVPGASCAGVNWALPPLNETLPRYVPPS